MMKVTYNYDGDECVADLNASGTAALTVTYDAWGDVQSAVSNGQLAVGNRYLFQGREYSFASGLYNFRARWYAPRLGRWLSNDPIGISGGLNLYEFCGNNPVNYVDPWGEDIYFDSGSGGHADLIIDNPKSPTGKTWFSFAPKEGGWNDLTLNLIGGPSKTTLKDWPTDVPTTAFRIPTTYEQDEAALCTAKEAQNDNFPYSAIPWINNCAHMTRTILRGAGLPFDNKFWDTPARLERDVRNYLQNK